MFLWLNYIWVGLPVRPNTGHWLAYLLCSIVPPQSPKSPASVCRHPALCVCLHYEQSRSWWRILSKFPRMASGEVFDAVSSVQTAPGDHSVAAQCPEHAITHPHSAVRCTQFIHQTIHLAAGDNHDTCWLHYTISNFHLISSDRVNVEV